MSKNEKRAILIALISSSLGWLIGLIDILSFINFGYLKEFSISHIILYLKIGEMIFLVIVLTSAFDIAFDNFDK